MTYFYIDTSSSYLYSGIVKDGKVLAEIKQDFNKELSKYTVSEIEKLFKESNLKPIDIDKIIVVAGPGSFTGIRIGMTFAKIFAWSYSIDITTITSLEAMQASINSKKVLVPLIDARRGYVYAGVYKNGKVLLKDQYIELLKLEDFLNNLGEDYFYITNDKKFTYENKFGYNPDILNITMMYKDNKAINPHLVEPIYLKLTEAEENLGSMIYDN
ncbi:MAG: tRNA (adenosine(37)-N6)-threonylcarbamoyltransferase complex dimerization subunit type 1 TsaB [Bacilli bacterium]|nr:tRNA (adenosine(37)-N6)-threonylcarbamoyltransferase complex dimerization subunit type 1 TsaB [Bacilli bacterium]